jgi:hypothetical protein
MCRVLGTGATVDYSQLTPLQEIRLMKGGDDDR